LIFGDYFELSIIVLTMFMISACDIFYNAITAQTKPVIEMGVCQGVKLTCRTCLKRASKRPQFTTTEFNCLG